MKKHVKELILWLLILSFSAFGCSSIENNSAAKIEPVMEEPTLEESLSEESEEETVTEAISQEEPDVQNVDDKALKDMEEAIASVGDVDNLSEEDMQGLVNSTATASQKAESTGTELALEMEYPFAGTGGQEEIDWVELEAQYPEISFVLSIPDLEIHLPVLLDEDVEADNIDVALVEGDINSDGFVSKLIVYTNSSEEESPLKNIRVYGDSQFFDEHPYLYIYTKDYTYEYQVFAAYNQYIETDIHEYNFDNLEDFWLYLGTVFNQKGMGVNINQDLQMTVMLEHQIFEILLPNSDGTVFAVQAVVNGRKSNK